MPVSAGVRGQGRIVIVQDWLEEQSCLGCV